jgi:purine-binding chemotaxis protein CheW
MQHETKPENEDQRYLIYWLGKELYGSPLLSIREVMKTPAIKSIPNMVDYFKGVMNLRGQIIGIIDLRQKLGIPYDKKDPGMVVVVEQNGQPLGAIVDGVVAVREFGSNDIEKNPGFQIRVRSQFFLGIAKSSQQLVNLIDVAECISTSEMKLKTEREAA